MPIQIVGAAATDLPPSILKLAVEADRLTLARIWRAVSEDERMAAAVRNADNDPVFRAKMVGYVARALHYRPETISRWPIEKISRSFARVPFREHGDLRDLVVALHEQRRAMMSAFLNAIDAAHDNGMLEDGHVLLEIADADHEAFHAAANAIAASYPLPEVVVYIASLSGLDNIPASLAAAWLRGIVARPTAVTVAPDIIPEEVEAADAGLEPAESDTFTKFDKSLIYTIVNSAMRIEGALDEDELDDLIDEVVHLNRERQRSWFHVGYRDALFRREVPSEIGAPNAHRLHWYWAGVIQGLTREYRWHEIVALYDTHRITHELGETAIGPCDAAAPWITTALIECDRAAEIPQFLKPAAVRHARIPGLLHREASRLLRLDRATEARGLYELLMQFIAGLESEGFDVDVPEFLEMRRRYANCLRQLDDHVGARAILENLVTHESDPEVLARVHADLGLIDGGFRRLSEVRLPREKRHLADLAHRLERGRARFDLACQQKTKSSAHARYCLGVLALACNRPEEAIPHLEMAASRFGEAPDRYAADRLLAQTGLYLAIAITLGMQIDRAEFAADLLKRAVREAALPPAWLVADVLEGLGLPDGRLHAEMAETLLNTEGISLDAILAARDSLVSPSVLAALHARAQSDARNTDQRLADYRLLLPRLIETDQLDDASQALDFMEDAATRGIGTDETLALLGGRRSWEPAWDHYAALGSRVTILEARRRYEEAAQLLMEEFHRVLSRDRYDAVDEAEGLLGIVSSYPIPPETAAGMRARLDALEALEADDSPAPATPPRRVRVLFVGGDEGNQMGQAAVREQLNRSYPHIDVTFIHTGWSSNWAGTLDDVCRKLPDHDAVVLMRFMRTMFGRKLRKVIAVPWRHCYGAGQQQMLRAVLAAARAVA